MKKSLFVLLILFSFAAIGSAQTIEAAKVDEFGTIVCDHLQGRLDYFFGQVMNESKTAKGYIIVYEGKAISYKNHSKILNPPRGQAESWIKTAKNQMKFRVIDDGKIIFIKGGFRDNFAVEFWIVPTEATPPKASPTLEKMKYRKGKATDICEGF